MSNTNTPYSHLAEQVHDILALEGEEAWVKVGDLFFDLWRTVSPRSLGHEPIYAEFTRLMEYITTFQAFPYERNRTPVLRALENLIRALDSHAA